MSRKVVDIEGEKMMRVTHHLSRDKVVEDIQHCKNRIAKAKRLNEEFKPKLIDLERILNLMPEPEPEPEPEPNEDL